MAMIDTVLARTKTDFQQRCSHPKHEIHCQMNPGPWEYHIECAICGVRLGDDFPHASLEPYAKSLGIIYHEYSE
jgi:hypothetical protein